MKVCAWLFVWALLAHAHPSHALTERGVYQQGGQLHTLMWLAELCNQHDELRLFVVIFGFASMHSGRAELDAVCPHSCSGHGKCAGGKCECDVGRAGMACELWEVRS